MSNFFRQFWPILVFLAIYVMGALCEHLDEKRRGTVDAGQKGSFSYGGLAMAAICLLVIAACISNAMHPLPR